MKKRNQKLGLNRETLTRLENLPVAHVKQIAGGAALADEAIGRMSSCGFECSCQDTF